MTEIINNRSKIDKHQLRVMFLIIVYLPLNTITMNMAKKSKYSDKYGKSIT